MLQYFRRRRPQHRATPAQVVVLEPADRIIAAHHKLSPERWDKLPAGEKQKLRESVAWELRAAS